jgi:plastocyanin
MAKIPVLDAVRIIPRDTDFLDRRSGNRGEIFYDRTANTLRLYDGATASGVNLAKSDLTNVSNAAFVAKATAAGVGGGGGDSNFELTIAADDSTIRTITSGNVLQFTGSGGISTSSSEDGEILISNTASSFTTIAVSGQSNIVADQINDTLTFVAGSNVIITTDAGTDTITISAAGGSGGTASDSFSTIAVAGQNSVVADSATDTLTLVAGSGISITTNAGTDTITITSTASAGATAFTGLSDSAGATVDQIYLPAITALTVTNNGASSYRFDQYGTSDNPTVYAINGTTIAFKLNVAGHPFLIQNGAGVNYDTGLIHVSIGGTVTTGASAQGQTSGTLYWKIPTAISGGYRYQCSIHAPMVGSISIKTFATL